MKIEYDYWVDYGMPTLNRFFFMKIRNDQLYFRRSTVVSQKKITKISFVDEKMFHQILPLTN